jgi:hypothetical protein
VTTLRRVRLENQRRQLIAESEQDSLNRTTAALRALMEAGYTDARELGYPIHGIGAVSLLYNCKDTRGRFRKVTVRVIEIKDAPTPS